ncbi:MAG: M23 family metallopeptidase [Defluviitaleaceae bacterium]|nr:M23 family metallopeptidase [Defluviitaleaceae bacterium]
MMFFVRIINAIWKIGFAWLLVWALGGLFGVAFNHPIFSLLFLLCLFVFLDIGFWMGMAQFFGGLIANVKHRANMPSVENYNCKVDYILPFEGKWTVFNGGVTKDLSHSWDIISQRYAYDFIIMDDEGKSFNDDNTSLQSYFCYGKNVVAPADGIVVKVSNKHKDSRANGTKVFCDTWDIRGNFIVIKHAEGEYSLCAHLVPHSITVQKGEKVTQGQIIAKCGNSGNTSEPHLHFQLQTGKSFFTSAGLPISFVSINAQEKANYDTTNTHPTQKTLIQTDIDNRVYIGRGLEVENI